MARTSHQRGSPVEWPHDILKSCLDYLPIKDLLEVRLVSKKWSAAVADCVECFFSHLVQDGNEDWKGTLVQGVWSPRNRLQLRFLSCCILQTTDTFQNSIRKIVLEGATFTGDCSRLESFPALEELQIISTRVTSVAHLSDCKALKTLVVDECPLTLVVNSWPLTDAGIVGLERIPTLKELSLSGTGITNVKHLSTCKALQVLDLSCCRNLTDEGIRGLQSLPTFTLVLLDRSGSPVTITTVAQFQNHGALKVLKLQRYSSVTEVPLIRSLEELDVSRTQVKSVAHLWFSSNNLKKLNLESCIGITDESIAGLDFIPTLEELNLSHTYISSVERVANCKALKKLHLAGCKKLSHNSLSLLRWIPRLEELDLSDNKLMNVDSLAECRALKIVHLWDNPLPQGIHGLESIQTLEEISLNVGGFWTQSIPGFHSLKGMKRLSLRNVFLTDDILMQSISTLEHLSASHSLLTSIACLSDCKKLKTLWLEDTLLNDAGVAGLERIPTLKELNLRRTQITSVINLSNCKALRFLDLSDCQSLDDAGVAGLERISTLKELRLSATKISSVQHLAGCKALHLLHLTACSKLTDEGIVGLELIPTLKELNLSATKIMSVQQLSACKVLQVLDLSRCGNLTDEGIVGLERIPTLKELNLSSTPVTSAKHLSTCKALEVLDLDKCPNLTDEGMAGLERIPMLYCPQGHLPKH